MQWYYDRIKDKSSELEKYPGYLPSIVRMAINLSNWYDFLKEKGLYEKQWMKSIQKDIFQ